jgi:hypothetical protein
VAALLIAFRREHGGEGRRGPKHAGYYALTIGKARARAAVSGAKKLILDL